MCMHGFLRSDTIRATLSQELQVLLPPLPEGAKVLRRVQLIVPASPAIYVMVDPNETDVGMNKNYNFPQMHPGQVIQFSLAPCQRLAGMSGVGTAPLSLVVEQFAME